MRKPIAVLLALCVLAALAAGACAAGTTLRTFTPFADTDFAAQCYMDLITAWEAESGNLAEDYSGPADEGWLSQLGEQLAAGAADVVVLPMVPQLTGAQLVTADELLAAAPESGAKRFASLAQADGTVLLAPLRLNWEALYVNTDVLARYGLSAPQTFEELLAACALLLLSIR